MADKNTHEKIAYYRKKAKLSQKELGLMIGVSDRAVSKWENGLSLPKTSSFFRLANILGVEVKDLLDDENTSAEHKKDKKGSMESICEIYKIGYGPSSSHTIGPENACNLFKSRNKTADKFTVILYGSLAKTGIGHGTDTVIKKVFYPVPVEIQYDVVVNDIPHPNTLDIYAYKNGAEIDFKRYISVGGGSIVAFGEDDTRKTVYSLTSFSDIMTYCRAKKIRIWQYVEECEGKEIWNYLGEVWKTMKQCIERGLSAEGKLPGKLNIDRKAKYLFEQKHIDESPETRENRIVCSYAFAVGEENAAYNKVVTAPTCGAAGVLPATLLYMQEKKNFDDSAILKALAVAGVIGNVIKTNASISGAECGCQAEIGSACSMAAAALAEIFEMSLEQIEYAAEVAMEHHLGLTCDPIYELVQIPCIERNAVAAMRAINAVNLSNFLSKTRRISFDLVVDTMYETGKNLSREYRETSEGGLAKLYN